MRRTSTIHIHFAAVMLIAVLAVLAHRVSGQAQTSPERPHRVATVDMLELLEDLLQTDDYKPDRDEFRGDWEEQIRDVQNILIQIEGELRVATPMDPNIGKLREQYQQVGMRYQQLQRQASMEFDRYSAEQAASAYATLHAEASALAYELGYSHLVASRNSGEIIDRSNLATVTQEILARSIIISPEEDDLTERLREKMAIPARPKPAQLPMPGTNMPNPDAEPGPTSGPTSGPAGEPTSDG